MESQIQIGQSVIWGSTGGNPRSMAFWHPFYASFQKKLGGRVLHFKRIPIVRWDDNLDQG